MAIVTLPAPLLIQVTDPVLGAAGASLNLATEEVFCIGQVFFKARTGSKVISSAGGRIFWLTASGVTFVDAATNLRVGIQDVNASGQPDGTFDVFDDLVGGTDTIASSALQNTAMSSGSKTINYGDTVAIGMVMTARGGADQVTVDRVDMQIGLPGQSRTFPYGFHLATKNPEVAQFLIKFDDGTYGWIHANPLRWNTNNTAPTGITYSNASTPDEYAGVFQFPFAVQIDGIGVSVGGVASADSYELILYSDPMGTPAVIESVAPDPDIIGVTNTVPYFRLLSTPRLLAANTKYAIALRPTTANTIVWGHLSLDSGFEEIKNAQPFSTLQMASRTDQSGAFAETNVIHLPLISLSISGIDVSAAGGAFVF